MLSNSFRTLALNASAKALSVGFPGREKSVFDSVVIAALVERFCSKLRPLINAADGDGRPSLADEAGENANDITRTKVFGTYFLERKARAAELIHHGKACGMPAHGAVDRG